MKKEEYISGMLERTALFYDEDAIEKIRNTVFAISGFGGVGAITAELLARWGIRRFRLLDMDVYEPSNLNRQLFASSSTLGRYKADVTAERIKEINPYAKIDMVVKDPVDNENVNRFLDGADIIIQTADSPSCQLFYRAAKKYKIPAVNGFSTIIGCRVQIYDYRKPNKWFALETIRDKKKFKGRKDLAQMNKKELSEFNAGFMHGSETGATLNFVTNIAGAMIVSESIKLLTETGKPCCFPDVIDLDLYNLKLSVKNTYSPFSLENFKKVFGKWNKTRHFKSYLAKRKKDAGIKQG
ncbi:tRNA threonylcarbamoyladenosine dehydratase [Desulfobacula phenolica]|uniref:ThiF family protein n=1 Tax=Desulfobacula phenolica TaxID=90732 RepID=A0A1H2EPN5_9BACT|nr:ThiF family adenylyltransferase [Desulfobacula phenolica]SDT97086.1 ThiF family protein [Desulfobacula phenolica]